MRSLRQRYPFLMVDRVLEHEPDRRIKGIKLVTINEPYFAGHFPDEPVMPGVMIVEAMTQTAGLIYSDAESGYLVALNNVKFTRFVTPGDVLVIEAEALERVGPFAKARVRATVDGQEVSRAEISYKFMSRGRE